MDLAFIIWFDSSGLKHISKVSTPVPLSRGTAIYQHTRTVLSLIMFRVHRAVIVKNTPPV